MLDSVSGCSAPRTFPCFSGHLCHVTQRIFMLFTQDLQLYFHILFQPYFSFPRICPGKLARPSENEKLIKSTRVSSLMFSLLIPKLFEAIRQRHCYSP